MPLGPMKTKAQKQAGMHEVMGEFKRGHFTPAPRLALRSRTASRPLPLASPRPSSPSMRKAV